MTMAERLRNHREIEERNRKRVEEWRVAMGSPNVVSVAYASDDPEIRNSVLYSDYVRNETLNRCLSIPSYKYKSLAWKNRYYDVIKSKVLAERRA